jgi:hypothetical protein
MKKILLISILCVLGIKGYSQLLEDKTNFYIAYQRGLFLGSELFNNHGTISPSFYSNLRSNNGLTVKYLSNLSPNLGVGLKLGFLSSRNWQSENYGSYKGSSSATIILQPVFQIRTKFNESGLYNRLKLYGELSPVIGFSKLSIQNKLFDISGYDENTDTFSSNNLTFGIEAGVGCEYAFTNKAGAFINMSVQEGFIKTPFFVDNRYTLLSFDVGVRINISKVKRFNY